MSEVDTQSQEEKESFGEAARILTWNRWLLTSLGIWPKNPRAILFGVNFGYFVYHMAMEYLDLWLHIDNLERVIENLTENMAFSQILVRMAMLRRYNRSLGAVIARAIEDFDPRRYRSGEETRAFVRYNRRAKLFVKLLSAFVVLTATSYYAKPLSAGPPERAVQGSSGDPGNGSFPYALPYRFHVFYAIEDEQTYVLTYLSHLPFVFVSGLGQTAADCLMVTLVFHVSGQMSILAMRVSRLNTAADSCDEELRDIVENHERLLRMGSVVQEAFSETLLAHLIGATSLVCILGYQVLTNFAKGQNADLMTFVTFAFLVLLVLYAHCTVGESLISESLNVCNAFYDCEWYNMPTKKARVVIICMARSQKPLCLTAGKFGIFCLSTLTEVLKTAMGYLSVLRTLL